jgi:hypothetical protein
MSEAQPWQKRLRWYYRGPISPGTHLSIHEQDQATAAGVHQFYLEYFVSLHTSDAIDTGTPITLPSATVRITQYQAGGIYSTADLAALNPETAPESLRIETLVEFRVPEMPGVSLNPPHAGGWRRRVAIPYVSVVLNRYSGPQLVGIEIISPWSSGHSGKFRVSAHLIQVDVDKGAPAGAAGTVNEHNLQLRALGSRRADRPLTAVERARQELDGGPFVPTYQGEP